MNEEYLYHYTTINSLAFILKNRKIQFAPLTSLDDIQEEQIKDRVPYSKFVFVSSWTDYEEEKISMWKMYTNMDAGVIIKLHKNPFEWQDDHSGEIKGSLVASDDGYVGIDHGIIDMKKVRLLPQKIDSFSFKICYEDCNDYLMPKIEDKSVDQFRWEFENLGKYKSTHWKFQDEYRYRLIALPNIPLERIPEIKDRIINPYEDIDLPFNNLYVGISNEAFEQMELILSPLITESNKIIVEALIAKYNARCRVTASSLSSLIRK